MIRSRVRSFPDKNYWAVFKDGVTMRFTFEENRDIDVLDYPEFYDFKITNVCGGKCPWCYMNSVCLEDHYPDIVKNFRNFFEPMSMNQRPFQIAFGGGNPNEHPEFCELMKVCHDLKILPNYTTNGMGITRDVILATYKYCGGVAMSTHQHLEDTWRNAIYSFNSGLPGCMPKPAELKVNLHHIVSDKDSIQRLIAIYEEFKDKIDYFVVLPLVAQGRATESFTEENFLIDTLHRLPELKQFAFGAKLYPTLQLAKEKGKPLPVTLYEPEVMSRFVDMKDMRQYPSSFDLAAQESQR